LQQLLGAFALFHVDAIDRRIEDIQRAVRSGRLARRSTPAILRINLPDDTCSALFSPAKATRRARSAHDLPGVPAGLPSTDFVQTTSNVEVLGKPWIGV
jgi:hypothetical protein